MIAGRFTVREPERHRPRRRECGFLLIEVVVAITLAGIAFGAIIYGYIQSARRAEWAAYSLAAQSLAMERLEQTRACKWDPRGYPPTDQLVSSNFPVQVDILDVPISGTNFVYGTNRTTISEVSTNPPLKMIRVDCVWPFQFGEVFTNTVASYRASDQ